MFYVVSEPDPAEFLEVLAGFQELLKTCDGLRGGVLRAIVDDDDLNMFEAGRFIENGETLEARFDQILLVVGRDQYRKAGGSAIFPETAVAGPDGLRCGLSHGRVGNRIVSRWRHDVCAERVPLNPRSK